MFMSRTLLAASLAALSLSSVACSHRDEPSTTAPSTTTTTPTTSVAARTDPLLARFEIAAATAAVVQSDAFTVDLGECDPERWFTWLALGSVFVIVEPNGDSCAIWLGGEIENPRYTGLPRGVCEYSRDHEPITFAGDGISGLAEFDDSPCEPTGFEQMRPYREPESSVVTETAP